MSKKLELHIGELRCDVPGCGYQTDYAETWETIADCIGRPCPKCGASLLTAEDYATMMMLYGVSMCSGDAPEHAERVTGTIEMNGTGEAVITPTFGPGQ